MEKSKKKRNRLFSSVVAFILCLSMLTEPVLATDSSGAAAVSNTTGTTGDILGGAGEFENYVYGDDWAWYSTKVGTATLCDDDDETTDPAGKYLQITGDGTNIPQMQWSGAAKGGTNYILKFYIKRNTTVYPNISVGENGTGSWVNFLQLYTRGNKTDIDTGGTIVSINGTEAVPQGEWTPFEYTFTTNVNTTQLRIRLNGNSATDDFCIDGITIAEAPSTPTPAPTPEATQGDILEDKGDFEEVTEITTSSTWYWTGEDAAGKAVYVNDASKMSPAKGKYLQITTDTGVQTTVGPKLSWQSDAGDIQKYTLYKLEMYIQRNSDDYPYIEIADAAEGKAAKTILRLDTQGGLVTSINPAGDVPKGGWQRVECEFRTRSNENVNKLMVTVCGNSTSENLNFDIDGISIVKVEDTVATVAGDVLEGVGEFEVPNFAMEGYYGWAWYSNKIGTATVCPDDNTTEAPVGRYLQVNGNGSGGETPQMQWSGAVKGGTNYILKFYIKRNTTAYPNITVADNGTGSFVNFVQLLTRGNRTDGIAISINGTENVPQDQWTLVEYPFTTNVGTTQLRIRLNGGGTSDDFCIDGISIVEVEDTVETVPGDILEGSGNFEERTAFTETTPWRWANSTTTGTATYVPESETEEVDPADESPAKGVYLSITGNGANKPVVRWHSSNNAISNGATYKLVMYIHRNSEHYPYITVSDKYNNDPTNVLVSLFTEGGKTDPNENYVSILGDENVQEDTWQKVEYEFTTSNSANKLMISVYGDDAAAAFDIDGVSVVKTAESQWEQEYAEWQQKLETEEANSVLKTLEKGTGAITLNDGMKIFYTDMQSTELEATVDTTGNASYVNGTVVFYVYQGQNEVWKSESVALIDGKANVTFDLSQLTDKDTPYCVIASLYVDSTSTPVASDGKNIYMYARPSALDANGNYVKFENFVPVLGYHVQNGTDLGHNEKITEINANVIQCGYGKSPSEIITALDNLQANGQKGLVCLYMNELPAGSETNATRTIEIISNETIRNHPALFGYNVMDEPFVHVVDNDEAAMKKDLENSYRLIRRYDTENLVIFVEAMENYVLETSAYADALITNPYWPAAGANVYKDTKLVKDSLNFNKPVWGLFSTYIMDGKKTNNIPYFNTADDVRNNNYQGLLAGLNGYGYFSLSDAGNVEYNDLKDVEGWKDVIKPTSEGYIPLWEVKTPTDEQAGAKVWEALKTFEAVEAPIIVPYFIAGRGTKISEEINIDAGYMYHAWTAEDGTDYMVVLNVKGEDVHVDIPVEKGYAQIMAGRESAELKAKSGKLSLDLVGVEALLLKLTDTLEGDILLGVGTFEDFEDVEAMPDGWNWYSTYTGTSKLCEDDDAEANPAGSYLQIQGNGSKKPQIQWASGVGDVEGETDYILKFWIKRNSDCYPTIALAEKGTVTTSFTTIATLYTQGGKTISIHGDENVPKDEWTLVEHPFTTSEGTNQLRLRVDGNNNSAVFSIDEVTIVKADSTGDEGDGTGEEGDGTGGEGGSNTPEPTPEASVDLLGGIGTFEEFVEMGTDWKWYSNREGIVTLYDGDPAVDPSGKYVKIESSGNTAPTMQGFSSGEVIGNTEYTLSFYIKRSENASPILYLYESAQVGTSGFGSAIVTAKTADIEPGVWTKVTQNFTTSADTQTLRVRLVGGTAPEEFYIDEITIVKADSTGGEGGSNTPIPTPTPEASADILEGIGEFEDFVEMGNGWNWYSTPGIAALCSDDDATADPVGKYLRLQGDGSSKAQIQWASDIGDVEGGTKYILRFWIKRNADSYPYIALTEKGTVNTSFTTIANLHTQKNKTAPTISIHGDRDVEKGVWTLVDYRFTTSEGTNQLRLRIMGNSTSADYCIDGITIVKDDGSIPVPTPTPPIEPDQEEETEEDDSVPESTEETTAAALASGDLLGGIGTFENFAAMGTDWNWYGGGVGIITPCVGDPAVDPSGNYVKITSDGTTAPKLQGFTNGGVLGNTEYTLTFYIKRNADSTPILYLYESSASDKSGFGSALVTVKTADLELGVWNKVTRNFTTGPDTKMLRIRLVGGEAPEEFCIDEIMIKKADGSTSTTIAAPVIPGDIMGGIGEFEDPYFDMENDWKWVSNSEGTFKLYPDDDAEADPVGQYLLINSSGTVTPKIQWASQKGSVTGGTDYVLKFYIKRNSDLYPYVVLSETSGNGFADIVTLHTNKNKTSGTAISIYGEEAVEKGEWVEVIYPFTTNEGTNQLRIRVIGGNPKNTAESFCIDGFAIIEADSYEGEMGVIGQKPMTEPEPEEMQDNTKDHAQESTENPEETTEITDVVADPEDIPDEEENKNSNIILWVFLIGACVILVTGYLLFRQGKATKKE